MTIVVLAALALGAPLNAAAAPTNDSFANRETLVGSLPIHASGSNVGATSEPQEPHPDPAAFAGHSIWFSWQAASTGFVTIGTCGSQIDTVLGVYTGSELATLTLIASNRYSFGPNCNGARSEVTFKAISGTTYQIALDGNAFSNVTEGSIELEISVPSPPPNDDFAHAGLLEGTSASTPFENWAATKQSGEPNHRGDPGGASVWFNWTAPRSGGVFLQACNSPQEVLLAAYTGASVESLTSVAPLEPNAPCDLTFMATAGVTYRIALDGKWNQSTGPASMGEGHLSLVMVPLNDDFENATPLDGGPKVLYVGESTIGATEQPGEPEHGGIPGGASVWFNWLAPGSGSVTISACDATFPILAAAYTGFSLSNLAPVQAREAPLAEPCGASSGKAFAFNIESGVTYRVAVDGAGGATGRFDLGVEYSDERIPEEPSGPSSGSSADISPPDTMLRWRSVRRSGRVVFDLRSTEVGSRFICRVDSRPFRPCHRIVRFRRLYPGPHVFEAKAINALDEFDPSPLVVRFRVPRHRSHN